MNEDLKLFLKQHGVDNIDHFMSSMNIKIATIEKVISQNEMTYAEFSQETSEFISISKILGCSESHLNFDQSLLGNFRNFFDSKQNNTYQTRGLSLLNVSTDNIMKVIQPSFDDEPIKTISVNGNYYISGNGLHRFMILKLFYILELYQGKNIQELDEKYRVKVFNKKLDNFKTFTSYFGFAFNPPVNYNEGMNEQDWLKKIYMRIADAQAIPEVYQNFISNFSFMRFINNKSGEAMINLLIQFFPTVVKDVVQYLCRSNHYEFITMIIDCINKNFPNEKEEILQIINKSLEENNKQENNSFEFFDLQQEWNGYGQIEDISSLPEQKRNNKLVQFAEGSKSLEKCLLIFWNRGIKTTASCKGNHISINCHNKPEINCEAYISFDPNSEWLSYLSKEIIENEDVVITDTTIYYFGIDHEAFFKTLSRDAILGKKDNKELLREKFSKIVTLEEEQKLEYKAFLASLKEIGFNEEQIINLCKSYLELNKYMNEFYSSKSEVERSEIEKKWREANEYFNADLIFYISRNNENIQNNDSLPSPHM